MRADLQRSVYLARLVGPVLVVMGVGMILNADAYMGMAAQFLLSPAVIHVGAALGLLGGVALVLAHNVWARDWRVILTLLGWISIVDSASWILMPGVMMRFASALIASPAMPLVAGALTTLIGGVLAYVGFVRHRM